MRVIVNILVVLHLLGAAAVIGPWLSAPREPRIPLGMVWGARAQLVTGLLLVAVHEMSSDPADRLNNAKVGVKLVVAIACAACAETANGRQRRALAADPVASAGAATGGPSIASGAPTAVPAAGLVQAAALLAVLNVCVAVLWG